jgi:hypothetical protein
LRPDDQVALEATSNALAIARILEPRVQRVVVATKRDLEAIAKAKAKTDQLDARMLARLLAAGFLAGSWLPDEMTRSQRRRLARRAQLVRSRTRSKNEIHAVLIRNLKGKPPMTDCSENPVVPGSPPWSSPATSATQSTLGCDTSTFSPARSTRLTGRSPWTPLAHPTCDD